MRAGGHLDAEAARRLQEVLHTDAVRARNRVDGTGDARDLAQLIELALLSVPAARVFADPGARRELAAFDRRTAAELDRWFAAPFAREAAMRAAIFRARGTLYQERVELAALMRAYRRPDEAIRRAARTELDRLLEHLYEETAALATSEAFEPGAPPTPPPPSASRSTAGSSSSLLVLPSPELIQGLAQGATLDATMLAALAASTTAEPAAALVADEDRAKLVAEAREKEVSDRHALRDLLRALAESVLGEQPTSFGAWRAACAAFHVADFRPATLAIFGPRSLRTLPFEHPGVPLARAGAAVTADADAWSSSASLFGAGNDVAGEVFAGAMLATCATRAFGARALNDRPNDPARAARALALCCAFRFAASRFNDHRAADDLRAAYDETIQASPPPALARWWSLEPRLAAAPGEDAALYPHTAALTRALLRGVQLASTLRDTYDEDWFRNPRLTPELLRDRALLAETASESRLIAWLREHAHL